MVLLNQELLAKSLISDLLLLSTQTYVSVM